MSREASNYKEQQDNEGREDLRALASLLNLNIIREDFFENTPSIVVINERGEEVHIGFPYGRTAAHGVAQKPSATKRIEGVSMHGVGDGSWLYEIDI